MSNGKLWVAGAAALAAMLTGCADGSSGPTGGGSQRISLMVGAAPAVQPGVAASETITLGDHEIVLDKVELVLSRIRLKRDAQSAECADPAASDDHGNGNGHEDPDDQNEDENKDEPRNDRCEKFIAGPLLVDLPLDGNVEKLVSVDIDVGTYQRVDFRIHKVTRDSKDAEFLADHPDLEGISIRVTGTYDGTPFVYTADVTAKQKDRLDPPLVVTEQGATDLTLRVDVSNWFVHHNQLIDPTSAEKGKPNAQQVRENIIRSFHLFKDHDHDGKEDHDH
jgi:hypothetical protein